MTKDEVIRLMKETGELTRTPFDEWCQRFANLVAEATSPQRKPLTGKEIEEAILDDPIGGLMLLGLMRDAGSVTQLREAIRFIARAIEQAHKIE